MQNTAKKILQQALVAGASAAEVAIHSSHGFNVTVRMSQVDVIEYAAERGFSLTAYIGHQIGSASSSELTEQAIAATINKAINITKFTQADPYRDLPEQTLLAYQYPDLDLYHPWELSQAQAIDLAKRCEYVGLQYDKAITNSEGVVVSTHENHYILANTHDFLGEYRTTQHLISATYIAERASEMQRDYEYTIACAANLLSAKEEIAKQAAAKTLQRLGSRKIKSQQVPIIFTPPMARSLLRHFVAAINGSKIYRQLSFLTNSLEKPVFPEHISLIERPHVKKSIASAPFDSEGVRTTEKTIVANGILKTYLLGSYSARKLGFSSTGNADGVHNLEITTAAIGFDQLLKKMDTGLLVTELIGQGVNLTTGDYSRGAFGFWVEHGEIQFPVSEITIAGNLRDIFANIVLVANDIDRRDSIHTGSILTAPLMVAGD